MHDEMPTADQRRQQAWDRADEHTHDVLVIGGGIVGAGVARDAALRGLRTALVEQRDFAFGTSSRSSRPIWSGTAPKAYQMKAVIPAQKASVLKSRPMRMDLASSFGTLLQIDVGTSSRRHRCISPHSSKAVCDSQHRPIRAFHDASIFLVGERLNVLNESR